MAGVIEWYYNDTFKSRRSYNDRKDRKDIMRRYINSVPVVHRDKMHIIIRPSITQKEVIELEQKSQLII